MREIVFQGPPLPGLERYQVCMDLPIWHGSLSSHNIDRYLRLENSYVRVVCDVENVERTVEKCRLSRSCHSGLIAVLDTALANVNPLSMRVVLCGPHCFFSYAVSCGLVPSEGAFFELFRQVEK